MPNSNGELDFPTLHDRFATAVSDGKSWIGTTTQEGDLVALKQEHATAIGERNEIQSKSDSLARELDAAEASEAKQNQQAAQDLAQGESGFLKKVRTKLRGFGLSSPRERVVLESLQKLLQAQLDVANLKMEEIRCQIERTDLEIVQRPDTQQNEDEVGKEYTKSPAAKEIGED